MANYYLVYEEATGAIINSVTNPAKTLSNYFPCTEEQYKYPGKYEIVNNTIVKKPEVTRQESQTEKDRKEIKTDPILQALMTKRPSEIASYIQNLKDLSQMRNIIATLAKIVTYALQKGDIE